MSLISSSLEPLSSNLTQYSSSSFIWLLFSLSSLSLSLLFLEFFISSSTYFLVILSYVSFIFSSSSLKFLLLFILKKEYFLKSLFKSVSNSKCFSKCLKSFKPNISSSFLRLKSCLSFILSLSSILFVLFILSLLVPDLNLVSLLVLFPKSKLFVLLLIVFSSFNFFSFILFSFTYFLCFDFFSTSVVRFK